MIDLVLIAVAAMVPLTVGVGFAGMRALQEAKRRFAVQDREVQAGELVKLRNRVEAIEQQQMAHSLGKRRN